jgi:hypothetical protein
LHACGNTGIGKNKPVDKAVNQSLLHSLRSDRPGGFSPGLLFQEA